MKRLSLFQSSTTELPFQDGAFDLITCFGLLEHLPEDVRRTTILEAFRVLKPKGKMIVVVNNDDCFFLEKHYSMTRQREDGYFACLVGYNWLNALCSKQGKRAKVFASNPMYGLVHYYISEGRKVYFGSGNKFSDFVNRVSVFDFINPKLTSFLRKLSSHFMVEIK
jgi:SAM-dependent methyltransferase